MFGLVETFLMALGAYLWCVGVSLIIQKLIDKYEQRNSSKKE